jgi:uncharacterized membrane protein YfcA
VLAWVLALYIVLIDFKQIVWREFLKILILVGVGMPIGMLLYSYLPEKVLTVCLGIFMLSVSTWKLYSTYKKTHTNIKFKEWPYSLLLFLGGIVHGAFGTGGPLVVVYASNKLKNKS